MYVYRCTLCDQVCTGQGIASHLRRSHDIRRATDYGTKGAHDIVLTRDVNIIEDGAPTLLTYGHTVAVYLFEATGTWNTEYKSGDREAFDEWLPDRLEYLDIHYSQWRPRSSK